MSIRSRLQHLEDRARPTTPPDPFPGWDLLHSPHLLGQWLSRQGYADALAAWVAGERGPMLEQEALRCWLFQQGYASAGLAVAKGALGKVPAHLESELRIQALTCYYGLAGDAIVGPEWKQHAARVTATLLAQYGQLRDYLGQRPIPAPDDTLLGQALDLVCALYQEEGTSP